MELIDHEVYFYQWCHTCKFEDVEEAEDPCDECLEYFYMPESHRPLHWKAKDGMEGYLPPEPGSEDANAEKTGK